MSLRGENISLSLGKAQILRQVQFEAQPGKVTAIVGPNGSGKTTLLRALTGEVPFQGTVRLNGQDTARMKPWELAAERAVLPQNTVLAFPFTVIEVVRMGLMAGLSSEVETLPSRALAAVGLQGYENRFCQELSGGEQQRVQLARILVQVWEPTGPNGARWLLLDEPVSALDIGHQLTVMGLMRAYARRGGGVVAVMHDLNLTAMAADHMVVMARGQMIAQGPVSDVLTDQVLHQAYGCALRVNTAPQSGGVFVLPQSAGKVA
ncbi:MAG: heme ABC transporter ATP-binding protein [Mangrovicoccus sp.]|nr:heme ABC transporter ATP-binding protein [Mangrovicoccus sp.]